MASVSSGCILSTSNKGLLLSTGIMHTLTVSLLPVTTETMQLVCDCSCVRTWYIVAAIWTDVAGSLKASGAGSQRLTELVSVGVGTRLVNQSHHFSPTNPEFLSRPSRRLKRITGNYNWC